MLQDLHISTCYTSVLDIFDLYDCELGCNMSLVDAPAVQFVWSEILSQRSVVPAAGKVSCAEQYMVDKPLCT